MRLEDAVRTGLSLPLARLGIVEIYVLGFAALLAARAPMIIGGILAIAVLSSEGRLQPAIEALREIDPHTISPGEPLPPGLEAALANLLSPLAIGIVAAAVTAAIVAWVTAQAFASAAGIHAIATALLEQADPQTTTATPDPVVEGLRGARADTLTFVGLALGRAAVGVGLPLLAFGLNPVLPQLAGSLFVLASLVAGPVLYFAMGFAEQAVVLEDRTALAGFRASLGFVRRRPGRFGWYLAVGAVTLVVLAIFGGLLGAGGQSAATAVTFLIVGPVFFDTFKTALYTETERPESTRSTAPRVRPSFRAGARGLLRMPVAHPVATVVATLLFLGGGAAGWAFTSEFGLELLGPGGGPYEMDPSLVGQIWINNWLVGTATALGGFAIGVPTVTNLAFNGALVGALAGVSDPVVFAALVGPHGIIEVPAIALAGSMGLVLGSRGWAAVRGRRSADRIARDIRWAVERLLALGVVFLVAAAVEAFVTPTVASALVGA